MANIELKSTIVDDVYSNYLYEKYDIQTKGGTTTTIPMLNKFELSTFDWNLGVVLGNSGSGKSTILKELCESIDAPKLDMSKAIVQQFPHMQPSEVCDLFFGIGLCSIPTLLHKPFELSNGERARFDIAYQLGYAKPNSVVYIDEFTSVVNRDVAKSMSFALQRYIRSKGLKVVLASCHFDIIDWLQPDWCYNLNKMSDGKCHIERVLYLDDKEYSAYSSLKQKDILSDAVDICQPQ